MSERENQVVVPGTRGAAPSRPDLSRLSELDLMLSLAETSDRLAALIALLEEGDDVGDLVTDVCGDVTDIEDELMRRGFSDQILST